MEIKDEKKNSPLHSFYVRPIFFLVLLLNFALEEFFKIQFGRNSFILLLSLLHYILVQLFPILAVYPQYSEGLPSKHGSALKLLSSALSAFRPYAGLHFLLQIGKTTERKNLETSKCMFLSGWVFWEGWGGGVDDLTRCAHTSITYRRKANSRYKIWGILLHPIVSLPESYGIG